MCLFFLYVCVPCVPNVHGSQKWALDGSPRTAASDGGKLPIGS